MPLPIYYVGTPAEVEHHALPLCREFDVRIEDAENVLLHAQPGDVCIFYNEFFPRYRLVNHTLVRRQCPTLYAIDGILEWRSLWQFPPGISCLWSMRPILCHKVACIGRSQARVLESWGLSNHCEVVGVPRFDRLAGRRPRQRSPEEPFTILVLTAKCPGFNQQQLQKAVQSLIDLKAWLDSHQIIHGMPVQSLWRITQGLESVVGIDNSLKDTTGQDLADVLTRVDAVITTPSTAMLEGMLQGVPVALLDYHNCPHYVPAAWQITAPTHFDEVVPELLAPSPAKKLYQQHLLLDALECSSPALPRLGELIAQMHELAQHCLARDESLSFPNCILRNGFEPEAAECVRPNYYRLFPQNEAFAEYDLCRLQAEVSDLREAYTALLSKQSPPVTAIEERKIA